MLTVISPAKTLDFESPLVTRKHSQPRLVDGAEALIAELLARSPGEIAELMGLSENLTALNVERYASWDSLHALGSARQAILAFKGDVYVGMDVERFDARDFTEAQKSLRILSGLYGVLRPLDLIHPHRLEMGTPLSTRRGRNLYEFWGDRIAELLDADLQARRSRVLVNLASQEYFGAVQRSGLDATVITPRFLDHKDGAPKIISFFAKKARGAMAAWIVQQRLRSPGALAGFDGLGYRFDEQRSTAHEPTFVRAEGARP